MSIEAMIDEKVKEEVEKQTTFLITDTINPLKDRISELEAQVKTLTEQALKAQPAGQEVHVFYHNQGLQDSVEIGTPSKGGAVKVYYNAADLADAQKRVDNSKIVRDYASTTLSRNIYDNLPEEKKPAGDKRTAMDILKSPEEDNG
jgi:hypothetical protein